MPYVVATVAAERYTPDPAEAIHTAATDANRHHVRTIHEPTRHGPVIVVEDAPAADPDALAAVATALAPAHGRLLLIDNGQPGSARRLLDGLTLPWPENTRPAAGIDDPRLATAPMNTAPSPPQLANPHHRTHTRSGQGSRPRTRPRRRHRQTGSRCIYR
jgi:hypothetical protein